jgi:hypothetical protein
MKRVTQRDLVNQLKGVGKILDILWNNSYYSMGKDASKRIELEMIYYFGENWANNMYKIIEDGEKPHQSIPVPTLAELALTSKK